jgi:hypothetical protein
VGGAGVGRRRQVRVAAAVWIIESQGRRIVVDPVQAADGILRTGPDALVHQEAVAALLHDAGYARDSIDTVVASHIDGIGMIAWRSEDTWTPFFPNAEVLLSRREYDAIVHDDAYAPQGGDALLALDALGVVRPVGDEHAITADVALRWTGVHTPGHQVVEIGGGAATMVGHLALSPLEFVRPPTGELAALRDRSALLIGPLWPAPGAGHWDGAAERLRS